MSIVLSSAARRPDSSPVPASPGTRAVQRAIEHIERHLCEPLTAGELAAVACMSRYHFARVFRAATGRSPMEYLRERRILRAQALLREGRQKISEIAYDLGFFDQSHFVRRFRHATGYTPANFARRHAGAADEHRARTTEPLPR